MANIPSVLLNQPKLLETTTFGVDIVTSTPTNVLRSRDHEIWFWADKFGNPLEDITVIGGNAKLFDAPDRKAGEIETMRLIMKDGKIYKNTLQ